MAEEITVQFSGALQQFIRERVGANGIYLSASEYIRDLVRRDYEREEERKWNGLEGELKAGLEADPNQFVPLDGEAILQKAKALRQSDAG